MAKKSKIAKNEQRKVIVARYAERRAACKAVLKDPAAAMAAKLEARDALSRMPRDASPTRVRNRDRLDGRPRGHLRRFGLSRVNVRALAHRGELPGVRKSSW